MLILHSFMDITTSPAYLFYKKHEKFIMAIEGLLIIIMLCAIWVMYYQDLQIKEEISLQCNWGEDDYFCYCEKSEAMKIKNLLENSVAEINLSGVNNVEMVS